MRKLKGAISLAMLSAGLAVVPIVNSTAAPDVATAAPGGDQLVAQLRDEASGRVGISRETSTGQVGFVRTTGDLLPSREAGTGAAAAAKATAFLDEYAAAFGARADQLVKSDVRAHRVGWTVTFKQSYRGVPVFAGELRAQVNRAGDLTAVNGFVAPDIKIGVDPRLSADQAGDKAVSEVRSDPPAGSDGKSDVTGIAAASTELVIYRTGAIRGDAGTNVLAYVVEVTNKANVRDTVVMDARSGKVLNRYSMIHDDLDREVYEAGGTAESPTFTLVWEEGDPFPGGLNEDQRNLVEGTADSYWLMANAFGRDSFDGDGGTMIAVNNDPRINCPNANWNGVTTNYCTGVTGDDTVSHEWGHALDDYSSDLIYQWQSGALDESYADVWGETVDMINTRHNEVPDTTRTEGTCSAFTRADVELVITAPADIAQTCDAAPASFGPVIGSPGFSDDVVVGAPLNGCTALTNAANVAGKFVYVDRGGCTFDVKADVAEAAGATGIIVGNNTAAPPSSMSGSAGIPGLMISQEKGAVIKAETDPIQATMQKANDDPTDNSYRWLSGETDPAFGGAIRDMWNPNCYGHPGKVSDAQYHCTTDDAGGVHRNSGVPNHAFALLVDGGTYNGVTVPSIGLDKAANLWWQTQQAYLTPSSDFVDMADGLIAACADLTGQDINQVSVVPDDVQPAAPITAPDCAAVQQAIAAVEMRRLPVQCNFQPLLDPGSPSMCGAGFEKTTLYKEGFEDGLAGWEKDSEVVFPGGFSTPWQADFTAPGGRAGGVARGVDDLEAGDCSSGAGDVSSRDTIISPVITMPDTLTAPKMSFDHYVATEFGFDGGNVKVSVNEGAFTLVPASAYLFNPYNDTMAEEDTNTSPMAGEPGFTGTDGGKVEGSWGTSVVNLAALGVKPGDELRIRLDFGRDGCTGLDGWYVDNLTITDCEESGKVETTTTLKVRPKSPKFRQDFKAVIKVKAAGADVAGKVLLFADRDQIGRGRLKDGRLVIRVKKNLAPGSYKVVAKYLGTDEFVRSKDKVTVIIRPRR